MVVIVILLINNLIILIDIYKIIYKKSKLIYNILIIFLKDNINIKF